jgi:hypothetical protein
MRQFLKRCTFLIFKSFSKVGVFVFPNHYYSPISDVNQLKKSKEIWAKKSELPAIQVDLAKHLTNLRDICLPFQQEFIGNKTYLSAVENHFGPGYGFIEAQALHGFIRSKKPKKIIEIGSGVSTYCMLKAVEINQKEENKNTQITCIDPFPSKKIKARQDVNLIKNKVQSVPVSKFKDLSAGDFLFIDSSHTVRPGGDVNYLILEVLPRLASGVFVHFHDIFLPYDYPRNVLKTYFQWMETSLLRAFMINNEKVRIVFCLSQLHYGRQEELKKIFPEYVPAKDQNGLEIESNTDPNKHHFPASIYLEIL